jgi:hypothetical protein
MVSSFFLNFFDFSTRDTILQKTDKIHDTGSKSGSYHNNSLVQKPKVYPTNLTVNHGTGFLGPNQTNNSVVMEIDCGDWLAREYLPAHQHCEPFTHLSGDPPRVCSKKMKAPCPPVRDSFLGPTWLIGCSPSA